MTTPSALPAAAQARLDALRTAGTDGAPVGAVVDPPAAPAAPAAPATPPAADPPAQGERITLSREEVNDMRAAANAAQTVTSRLEEAESRNEALMQRLTELEASHKGNPTGTPAPGAPAPPAAPTALTIEPNAVISEEETTQFGESRAYIEKIARLVVAEVLNPILNKLGTDLSEVRNTAGAAQTGVKTQAEQAFAAALAKEAPNFRELVRHKNWNQFLDEVDPTAGLTYEQLLGTHIGNKQASKAAVIYNLFAKKYVAPAASNGDYAGGLPGAGAADPPAVPATPQKLKFSDRKKANKDYTDKKISWDDLQEITKAFNEAEKTGNIDYNA